MNTAMQILTYALLGVFAQNLIFTCGVGAERALRIPRALPRIFIASGAVMFFSWIAVSEMHLIRILSVRVPFLQSVRVLTLVVLLAVVYLLVLAAVRRVSTPMFVSLAEALPSGVFNSVVMMAGISEQMLQMPYTQAVGYAIGTGFGFLLAALIVQNATEYIGNAAMPHAFTGLPALLIYIGILAMAFVGFAGGPTVFL